MASPLLFDAKDSNNRFRNCIFQHSMKRLSKGSQKQQVSEEELKDLGGYKKTSSRRYYPNVVALSFIHQRAFQPLTNRFPVIRQQSPSNPTEKSTSLSYISLQHHWQPIINMIRLGRLLGRWPSTTSAFRFAGTKATEVTHHKDHHEEDHDHDDDHGHHGHHEKPYDWRDDFSKNPEYSQDILNRGCRNPSTYHYPHDAPPMKWAFSHPENYDQQDLTKNFVQVKHIGPITNKLRATETQLEEDIAHEFDYESEDLDFQPETFHSQHFRKKGHVWMWVIVGLMPIIFWVSEFFVQKYPNEDYWRFQRPPPLNYPDTEDTPDEETYQMFHSPEFRRLYEAGLLVPPYFDIVEGKKIYTKEAGVNQPMDDI